VWDVKTALFVALLALVSWVSPLFAQESYRDFERGLNLSDTQKAQVSGIRRKYVDEWRSLKEESLKKRLELNELNRGRPDQRDRAERVQKDLDQIESSRHRLLRQYSGEVSAIFNQDQRTKYEMFRDRETRRPMTPPPGRRLNER
jgi:hypothetical protein